MTTNKSTFADRVQALPQELFDEIYELTLTGPHTVDINNEYKPPVQLQIDRASRDKFARKFYTDTTFTIVADFTPDCNFEDWLRSLPRAHLQQLRKLRVDSRWLNDDLGYARRLLEFVCARAVVIADNVEGMDGYLRAIHGESSFGAMEGWQTNVVVKKGDGETTVEWKHYKELQGSY